MSEQSRNKAPDNIRRKLLLGGSATLAALTLSPAAALSAGSTPRQQIVLQLQKETGLEISFIEKSISRAIYDASVIKRIKTPYESKTYAEYRPLFVHQRLADKGLAYMKEHQQIFERAEKQYGVQPEIIAAILGMET
ncbi:MAG: lytic murein transglycosylase, partial [Mariprofundaceae bacterium]|nr:lytic murein transglycosylase [Mariprofundaceae bacterium]